MVVSHRELNLLVSYILKTLIKSSWSNGNPEKKVDLAGFSLLPVKISISDVTCYDILAIVYKLPNVEFLPELFPFRSIAVNILER